MPTYEESRAALTGPGGPFEVVTERVRGVDVPVYRHRLASLREILPIALGRADEIFLVQGERRVRFGDFVGQVGAFARSLTARLGIGRGDRVALLAANRPEWAVAFWGTVSAGAVSTALNGWWKPEEILYGLIDCGARVLVVDRDRLDGIASRLGEAKDLETVVVLDETGERPPTRAIGAWADLVGEPTHTLPATPIGEDDPAVIFYTSGTTGRSKGAVLSHRAWIAALQNLAFHRTAAVWSGAAGSDAPGPETALVTLPLFHVGGCHTCLVAGLFGGMRLVFTEGRFDPKEVLRLIASEGVTRWSAVPTMVRRVCREAASSGLDLSSVRAVTYGGSPAPADLQRQVRETFPNTRAVGNGYGLTESGSVIAVIEAEEFAARPTAVGRVFPAAEVRIVDACGQVLAAGEIGEICIRGSTLMTGYWGNPQATSEMIRDGWLHSGDVGFVDAEGFLHVTDRARDMIIRGGENVYCAEIESRLVEHPAVLDAAVVGAPHPDLGEEVRAILQVAGDPHPTVDEIRAWVAATLADFKVPSIVEFRATPLPRNATGKLLKNELRSCPGA